MPIRMRKDFECFIDGYTVVNIYMAKSFYGGSSQSFHLKDETGKILPLSILRKEDAGNYFHYACSLADPIEVGRDYTLFDEHCQSVPAQYAHIVKSQEFAKAFVDKDAKLGCFYTPKSTRFALWSPVAVWAEVILVQDGKETIVRMKKSDKGVWSADVKGNWLHASYTYRLKVNGTIRETYDPYNPFTGVNTSCSFVDDPKRVP